MAIVEDEVRNESEEENEIEVVVEEDDADQDSDDSDDDDDVEEVLERKVADLERLISEDPYNYDTHIDLIQALWGISDLEKWRAAFDHLQQMSIIRADDWLLRLQTEETLAHTAESYDYMTNLFQQALLDCYSNLIFNVWCSWCLRPGSVELAKSQLDEILRRAGADPLSGKSYWNARLQLEKTELDTLSEDHAEYMTQKKRVLWCLEEIVSRPLLRNDEMWEAFQELALAVHDQQYVDKVKIQHDAAVDYLQKITPFEDKLLVIENQDEKCKVYQEYINTVKELSQDEKFADCDSNGILKVLYERATTECMKCEACQDLLLEYVHLTQKSSSRATQRRVLDTCTRRCPRKHTFWILKMQQAEHEERDFDEIKAIFETALAKGMESYKQAEALWLSYLEYCRRQTSFDCETEVDRLRRTFRLAWDSLAEAWGEEANDCEVPLYWARLEYKRMKDPKQGKEIFEEIFKYGENKTMSKYWEALVHLECSKDGSMNEHKLRDLHRRALRCVEDYPPAITRLWIDFERDYGSLSAVREASQLAEVKLKEWRENYQAMKDKMMGQKQKGKQSQNKKPKTDNKKKNKEGNVAKGKRKSGELGGGSEVKRKKESEMEIDEKGKAIDSGGGVKRPHEAEDTEEVSNKRVRTDSGSSGSVPKGKEACTLFVSNLEFKVNEQNLRHKLSQYGDIVSLRVKTGVKAFGGSICYCQYKTPESVEEALKHDRTPLDGRPMFFSRYSASKSKPTFKYSTGAENNKLFVRNLPFDHCTKDALTEVFGKFGSLKDVRIVTFKDGKPKGLAYIEFDDEESAAKALEETNGMQLGDRPLNVAISAPPPKSSSSSLGQPKRDASGGMRRTQLSSFIPSVLQKPSTSKTSTSNGSHSNGDGKRPLSNVDFRNMLLKK